MRTLPETRPRFAAERMVGAMLRIVRGAMGVGFDYTPAPPTENQHVYHFHEGDLFNPGTGNYVFEPVWELPIHPFWGDGGVPYKPNRFSPLQPPTPYVPHYTTTQGLGGLQAGQLYAQPLVSMDNVSENPVGGF